MKSRYLNGVSVLWKPDQTLPYMIHCNGHFPDKQIIIWLLPITEEPVFIDAPDEIKNNPDFYEATGPNATVHKQVIGVELVVKVTDYWAKVYRNRKTGAKYHAPFPDGVQLDVNYDDSLKVLVFLLRNHLNVSIEKTREFLEEMTDGLLCISHGKISGINKEFARKTKSEQDAIFANLAKCKTMYNCKGYRLMTLGWTDGNTFLPVNSSLLATSKESNLIGPIESFDGRSLAARRRKLAQMKGTDVMIELLKTAQAAGHRAGYVLFDTWFSSPS